MLLADLLERLRHRRAVADVEDAGLARAPLAGRLRCDLRRRVGVDVEADDVRALARRADCDRLADARPAADDDGGLS